MWTGLGRGENGQNPALRECVQQTSEPRVELFEISRNIIVELIIINQ